MCRIVIECVILFRSTITVFPNRTKPFSDFRVWNVQLIGYAGYKNPDGTILGDPAKVEFTEVRGKRCCAYVIVFSCLCCLEIV